jgi:hypothetical protein
MKTKRHKQHMFFTSAQICTGKHLFGHSKPTIYIRIIFNYPFSILCCILSIQSVSSIASYSQVFYGQSASLHRISHTRTWLLWRTVRRRHCHSYIRNLSRFRSHSFDLRTASLLTTPCRGKGHPVKCLCKQGQGNVELQPIRKLGGRRWVARTTPRPPLPTGKTRCPFYTIRTSTENLVPTGIPSPDRQARSESLYSLDHPSYQFDPVDK